MDRIGKVRGLGGGGEERGGANRLIELFIITFKFGYALVFHSYQNLKKHGALSRSEMFLIKKCVFVLFNLEYDKEFSWKKSKKSDEFSTGQPGSGSDAKPKNPPAGGRIQFNTSFID